MIGLNQKCSNEKRRTEALNTESLATTKIRTEKHSNPGQNGFQTRTETEDKYGYQGHTQAEKTGKILNFW